MRYFCSRAENHRGKHILNIHKYFRFCNEIQTKKKMDERKKNSCTPNIYTQWRNFIILHIYWNSNMRLVVRDFFFPLKFARNNWIDAMRQIVEERLLPASSGIGVNSFKLGALVGVWDGCFCGFDDSELSIWNLMREEHITRQKFCRYFSFQQFSNVYFRVKC